MEPVGPLIQSSFAGVSQAQREQTTKQAARERVAARSRRANDQADFGDGLVPTDAADAVRSSESNDQEEAHEDRRSHDWDHAEQNARQRRLDLEG